jgi:hypothetical protein
VGQQFDLVRLCVKVPPSMGFDNGHGTWVGVLPKQDVNAIRILRFVPDLHTFFGVGDKPCPVILVLNGTTRCYYFFTIFPG